MFIKYLKQKHRINLANIINFYPEDERYEDGSREYNICFKSSKHNYKWIFLSWEERDKVLKMLEDKCNIIEICTKTELKETTVDDISDYM